MQKKLHYTQVNMVGFFFVSKLLYCSAILNYIIDNIIDEVLYNNY